MQFLPFLLSSLQLEILPRSVQMEEEAAYALARGEAGSLSLVVAAPPHSNTLLVFHGECFESVEQTVLVGPLDAHNAAALEAALRLAAPASAGTGDLRRHG